MILTGPFDESPKPIRKERMQEIEFQKHAGKLIAKEETYNGINVH